MHSVLLILKIIGNIVLLLFCICLVLLILLLFVPFRYQLEGRMEEKEIVLHLRVSFLFAIFMLKTGFNQKLYGKIHLFGFPLFDLLKRDENPSKKIRKNKKKKNANASREAEMKEDENADNADNEPLTDKSALSMQTETFSAAANKKSDNHEAPLSEQSMEILQRMLEKEKQKLSFGEKIALLWEKIREIFQKIASFCHDLENKTQETVDNLIQELSKASKMADFLQSQEALSAFYVSKRTLQKLWKHIRPRKMHARLHVGFADPASTGQICTIYGFFYPFVASCVMIEPDFEQTVFEGDFFLKGHLTIFQFVKVLWIFLFHRDLKCIRVLIRKRR